MCCGRIFGCQKYLMYCEEYLYAVRTFVLYEVYVPWTESIFYDESLCAMGSICVL